MYKHILLAGDGSDHAIRAAQEAITLASSNTSEALIELLYIVDFEKVRQEVLHSSSTASLHNERRQKIQNIENLLRDAHVRYKVTIVSGTPTTDIVKYAHNEKVDVIVIGSRGLNTLQKTLLGSVSQKVISLATCPVLVVK